MTGGDLKKIRAAAYDGTGRPWDAHQMLRDVRTLLDFIEAQKRGLRIAALEMRREAGEHKQGGDEVRARLCERHAELVERVIARGDAP
jgi:hypothetical protein